jgi:hypothetical protein
MPKSLLTIWRNVSLWRKRVSCGLVLGSLIWGSRSERKWYCTSFLARIYRRETTCWCEVFQQLAVPQNGRKHDDRGSNIFLYVKPCLWNNWANVGFILWLPLLPVTSRPVIIFRIGVKTDGFLCALPAETEEGVEYRAHIATGIARGQLCSGWNEGWFKSNSKEKISEGDQRVEPGLCGSASYGENVAGCTHRWRPSKMQLKPSPSPNDSSSNSSFQRQIKFLSKVFYSSFLSLLLLLSEFLTSQL